MVATVKKLVCVIVVILSALALNACGDLFGIVPQYIQTVVTGSPAQARAMAFNASVSCANRDGSGCSPSVGMLTLTIGSMVGQCTAFLVSPQVAITNSHCIPDDLRSNGADCRGRMWLHFADLPGYPSTRVACTRVLMATQLRGLIGEQDKVTEPDYAVIQLSQPLDRPSLQISRAGFATQTNYHIIKVNPENSEEQIMGQMMSVACPSVASVVKTTTNVNPNIYLGDCNIVRGNSGSPILDSSDNVHGVIQAIEGSGARSQFWQANENKIYDEVDLGTNFACLSFPAEVYTPEMPTACGATNTSPSITASN